MSTVKRLKQYLDYKGITNQNYEIEVGFSNGAFGTQLRNDKNIGSDKLENTLKSFPDLSAEWLLTGVGKMIKEDTSLQDSKLILREPESNYSTNTFSNHNDLANYIMDNEEELMKNKRFSTWHKGIIQEGRIAELRDFINSGTKKAATAASGK